VHVIGKFRKERDIPMQPDAQVALAEQIKTEGRLWRQNPQRLRTRCATRTARDGWAVREATAASAAGTFAISTDAIENRTIRATCSCASWTCVAHAC